MEQECLICYSPMSSETSIIFEECGHSFCMDCVQEWLTRDHERCPFDRIKIQSLNLPNQAYIYIEINTVKTVLKFLDFDNIQTSLHQQLSFPNFHAVNQETTDEEFDEMVTDFFTNSKFEIYKNDLSDLIFNMIFEYNFYYERIPHLVGYELRKNSCKIEHITITNAKIIDNSKGCLELYREKLIDRAQFIDYLKIVSDMLNEHYQQYIYHVNLYKLLLTKVLDRFNRFISDKVKAFFPNFLIESHKINLSLSDISDVPTINKMKALRNAISKSNTENDEEYIFDDLLNESMCFLEGLTAFLRNTSKISKREKDSLIKEELLKTDLYILWEKSPCLCTLFNTEFVNLKLPSKSVLINEISKITNIIEDLIAALIMRFEIKDFSVALAEGMKDCKMNLRRLQRYCKDVKRCDKVEKLLEALLYSWPKI